MDTAKTDVFRRYERAKARRDLFNPLLEDGYSMTMPGLDPSGLQTEGKKTDISLYEGQGVRSLTTRIARMHSQLFPPADEQIVEFELDGVFADDIDDDALFEQIQTHLDRQARRAQRALTCSNFHLEIPQCLGDALISTGAIMVTKGPSLGAAIRFEAIPISQLAFEEGATGLLETLFRRRDEPFRNLRVLWPDISIPTLLAERHNANPDGLVQLLEAQIHDPDAGKYEYRLFLIDGEIEMVTRRYNSPAIIAFRMGKLTGETLGRGPVLNCRADLKTANQAKKMQLQNMSLAVSGVWQADDDGVLNPANIKLVPGTIIPKAVGSQGLQPLKPAADFNASELQLAELRQAIKETIEGPPLPGYDQDRPVAYAFQVAERTRAEVEIPQHLRLYYELDMRLWWRIIDLLSQPDMAGSPYFIELFQMDGRQIRPIPKNPLIRMQENQRAMQAMQAFIEVIQIAQKQVIQLIDLPKFLRRHLLMRGFPADCILTRDQLAEEQQKMQKQQQAMLAGAQQGFGVASQMSQTPEGAALAQTASQMMGAA